MLSSALLACYYCRSSTLSNVAECGGIVNANRSRALCSFASWNALQGRWSIVKRAVGPHCIIMPSPSLR